MSAEQQQTDMDAYIRQGTSWTPYRQLHFLNALPQPEFELTGSLPTRGLGQAILEDLPDAMDVLRRTYTPKYYSEEYDVFSKALLWAHNNSELMQSTTIWEELPREVQAYYQTLYFAVTFKEGMGNMHGLKLIEPVAFHPDSTDFPRDVRRLTLPMFERLRLLPLECGKSFDPRLFSTSRTINTITRYFWSGGQHMHEAAADLLTSQLLKEYWLALRSRAKRGSR